MKRINDALCPVCGTNPLGRNKNACSRQCYTLLRSNVKSCVVCGAEFRAPPSSAKVTCSRSCSAQNRKRMAADGVYDPALDRAHERIAEHPLTGPFETHVNAKDWVIQSPTGQIYKCRNLMLWLRENTHLYDGTAPQAFRGFSVIKASLTGKRKKNKCMSWKGWKLLEWGE